MCEPVKQGQRAYDEGLYRGDNPYVRGTHQFVMWLKGWREAEAAHFWRIEND